MSSWIIVHSVFLLIVLIILFHAEITHLLSVVTVSTWFQWSFYTLPLDLKKYIYLYWSIIALHCSVSFCCRTKWISYTYTYIPISLPSCISLPPSLLVVTNHRADLPVLCDCFPLAIYFTFGSVYMSMPLSHFVPAYPSSSLCPQVHSLHLRLYFCLAPGFFRTSFFLDSIYMC